MYKCLCENGYSIQKYTDAFFHELISSEHWSRCSLPHEPDTPPPPAPAKLAAPPLVPPQCACQRCHLPWGSDYARAVFPEPHLLRARTVYPKSWPCHHSLTRAWASASLCKMEVTTAPAPMTTGGLSASHFTNVGWRGRSHHWMRPRWVDSLEKDPSSSPIMQPTIAGLELMCQTRNRGPGLKKTRPTPECPPEQDERRGTGNAHPPNKRTKRCLKCS